MNNRDNWLRSNLIRLLKLEGRATAVRLGSLLDREPGNLSKLLTRMALAGEIKRERWGLYRVNQPPQGG